MSLNKICPRCQCPTFLDAEFCRQCGHQFRTQFTVPQSPSAPGRSPWPIVGVVVAFLVLAGLWHFVATRNVVGPTMTPKTLQAESALWNGRTVRVRGVIENTTGDMRLTEAFKGFQPETPMVPTVREDVKVEWHSIKLLDLPPNVREDDTVEVVGQYSADPDTLNVYSCKVLGHEVVYGILR